MKSLKLVLLVSFYTLFMSSFSYAQFGDNEPEIINPNPLSADLRTKELEIPAGANREIIIDLELAKKHHAYYDQFKLRVVSPEGLQVNQPDISNVVEFFDKVSKTKKKGVKGRSTIKAVVGVPQSIRSGVHPLKIQLTYQACTEKYCLFPKNINLESSLKVLARNSEWSPPKKRENGKEWWRLNIDEALETGGLALFALVFLGGILSSFTPCIFPMIPITLTVLGARTKAHGKIFSFLLSLLYVLGIATTYSLLGLGAALTGSLFGSFLGHPVVAWILALIFIAMALSLFGVYDLQVPGFIRNRIGTHKTKGGLLGAYITGIVAGIVASPCIGPVLVGVLAYVAKSQDILLGFSLLFVFAFGLGQIFLLLGTFSSLFDKLPKAGPWMNITKFLFGSTMLAVALYYLSPVVTSPVLNIFIGLSLILVSAYHGAFKATENKVLHQIGKALLLLLLALGIAFVIDGAFPHFRQQLTDSADSKLKKQKITWEEFSYEKLNAAKAKGKPVILDFYADWCAACKELEVFTYTNPAVIEESKRFVKLKFDATNTSETFSRLQKEHNILGLPLVLFFNSEGQVIDDLRLTGFEKADKFLQRMKQVP